METRARDIAEGMTDFSRETAENLKHKAGEWTDRTKEMSHVALEKAQAGYNVAQEKTVACLKATNEALRTHPYAFVGVALGLGILIGVLARRD